MTNPLPIPDTAATRRELFQSKMMDSVAGAFNVFTMYLGDRLGLYKALAKGGSMTAGDLALASGTNPRYIREWLEQQTVAGILEVENPDDAPDDRRFLLPEGHDEVLTDSESLEFMAGVVQCVVGAAKPMDRIADAYRTGKGVPFDAYGRDMREGISRVNRPMYRKQLGQEWIAEMPGIVARLSRSGARVADIGCGVGDSSIALAKHFPEITVDGFDMDPDSIEEARQSAQAEGLSDRVTFNAIDAADAEGAGEYDLVMALECIHDMPHPVSSLTAMKRLMKPGGAVFIADERVGDRFTPHGEEFEWMMYGFSVLHCLPSGMCGCNPAGTGTVMRSSTLRKYATDAGFNSFNILPIDHLFFRFYHLT